MLSPRATAALMGAVRSSMGWLFDMMFILSDRWVCCRLGVSLLLLL